MPLAQVQGMGDPEYYVGALRQPGSEQWTTTKYSDRADGKVDVTDAASVKIWNRRPLYCSAVPGESSWVAAAMGYTMTQPLTSAAAGEMMSALEQRACPCKQAAPGHVHGYVCMPCRPALLYMRCAYITCAAMSA